MSGSAQLRARLAAIGGIALLTAAAAFTATPAQAESVTACSNNTIGAVCIVVDAGPDAFHCRVDDLGIILECS
ncbi:hypothetical protein P2Q00_49755 [Streptomyces coacervatus]|uniref:hypothetical protein n=1 Tax=Streptomyces coacervatus TaxID=647381 RepID=UPI0023DA82AD|nr:hypothetical protein [Streptomyces coacervatus]MDF2273419.1 hypothetical protein [Streptomyces coacervatus]